MKFKFAVVPIGVVSVFAGYLALHPGVAYAEPRMASEKLTPLTQEGSYTIDSMHTTLYFEINHLGLSTVRGRFNTFSGKVHEDAKDLTKSSVELTADVSSIDTAVPERDKDLRSEGFFDVEKYPTLTFKSTKIVKTRTGYVLTGDLTIKGRTKSISLPFKHYGPLTLKGMGDQGTRIGVIADPITIKRSDFGVGSTAPLPDGTIGASDDVRLLISMEATLDK